MSMHGYLQDPYLMPHTRSNKQAMRTFHHDLHIIGETADYVESLCNCHLRLLSRESIEPLEDQFYFVVYQQFLHLFFCHI